MGKTVYVVKHTGTGEYLAKRTFGSYYMTWDVTAACRFKNEILASDAKVKQDISSTALLEVSSLTLS